MKFIATLLILVIAVQAAYGFAPSSGFASSKTQLMEKKTSIADEFMGNANEAITKNVLTVAASTTGLLLSLGIDPVWAAAELPPDTSYIGKDFTAAYLPAVMVPLVGLVFPAFSMALFFLFSQVDDIESA
jgi:photosystem I reaction center subunit VIII